MRARYLIRLASGMQCNPVVMGLAIFIFAGLAVTGAAGIRAHETGTFQAARGVMAGALTLAALGGLAAVMRWAWAQDAPREPAIPLDADETEVMMSWLSDADREAIAAEAELLAADGTTVLVSGNGALYGLQDDLAEDEEAL